MNEPEPIRVLTEQEVAPARDFLGRVRREIERKEAAVQLVSFSWQLPQVLVLELLKMFDPGKGKRT
ncbi:MAG: hypothetical protein FJW36_25380 [Acidobacteria bacterium]|nr:hypothetical protein [Acidobacteriota bacterium]